MHISPDDEKHVALFATGADGDGGTGRTGAAERASLTQRTPVTWEWVAKDGADLPMPQRREQPADLAIAVGETFDFIWTPAPGNYTLRVITTFHAGAPQFPRPAPPPDTTKVQVRVR
jgi:hypothetical protein